MPDESAFLRTICDAPDDDGPRLVYADWLEESGDTLRAEFIRVGCAAAQPAPAACKQFMAGCDCGHCKARGEWSAAVAREGELLASDHPRDWAADLDQVGFVLLQHKRRRPKFQAWNRGFVESVRASSAVVGLHLKDALQRWPLRHIYLADYPARPIAVGEWKLLPEFDTLAFFAADGPVQLAAGTLRTLNNWTGSDKVTFHLPHLPTLRIDPAGVVGTNPPHARTRRRA